MNFPPIALIFLACGAISAILANYAWQRRTTMGSQSFALFMLAVAIYSLGYGMELASPDLQTALFWSKIQYIGIVTFPTMYLVFVIQYIGSGSWLTARNLGMLFSLPTFFLIVKLIDNSLQWIYAVPHADVINATLYLSFERGPLYIPLAVYQLTVVTIGNFLLIQKWRFSSQLYKRQTTILFIAAIIPYLSYIVYLLGIRLPALDGIDFNPLSYAFWAAIASLAISRYHLLNLAPIARDALIERLSDGVIVLDAQARLVDANPQALAILSWPSSPIGEDVKDIHTISDWVTPQELHALEPSTKKEVTLIQGQMISYYQLTLSVLKEKHGRKIGYLILVHDITDQKEIEKKLEGLSLTDELTGLNNRRGFNVLAEQLMGITDRMQVNAVLFYVDLDGLKKINDDLGHAAGDEALKGVASILKESFRTTDVIARLGGDEFVVLAIESKENSTVMMLERLRIKIDTQVPLSAGYKISMSIGQAHYDWKQPKTIAELIRESDRSMYEEKKAKGIGLEKA